jgi:type I restriction enzyme S subunit
MAVNQDIKVLQPKTEQISSKYLLNILLYESNRIRASCAKTGTTVESIETGFLKAYKIPLPPLPEQRRIADILSTVDEQIKQTGQKIEKTEKLKRGVVQDLLVQQGSESPQSTRFGPLRVEIPDSWAVTTMEEICASRQLGTGERGDPDDDGVSLIKMGNLGIGSWDLSEVENIRNSEEILDKCSLKKGDLLFNTRNSPDLVGKTAVWEFDFPAVFDNNLLRLRFNNEVYDSRFINLYLSSDLGRNYLQSLVHGTTSVAAIYWKDLKNLKIPLPAKDVQRQIVNVVDSIDSHISTEKEYEQSLRELKRGLMQDLLTGNVRVTTET